MRKIALAIAATAVMLGGAAVQAKPKLTPQQRLDSRHPSAEFTVKHIGLA